MVTLSQPLVIQIIPLDRRERMALSNSRFKLIKAARLIDGKSDRVIERGAILIEGDLIRAVGPEENVAPPEGAQVEEFNYEGKTLLPGLVDCHVHLVG
ncbi:MAG: hypothetical protein IIB15_05975, partial [Chloroflexi bacterium]|nr:hypothetical protein [Chloroflexota bacterium]